jgi:prepilin-type N-terminal cleavage/methylation domain-containing protein
MNNHRNTAQGFTLIELLIVIAIIAILAAVVFVALNPLQRFKDARDARRWSDVSEVLSAVKLNQVDNAGAYLTALNNATSSVPFQIGTDVSGCNTGCTATTTAAACLDLSGLTASGHLGAIPFDPSAGSLAASKYYIIKAATGIVTVGSCTPEGVAPILVTR